MGWKKYLDWTVMSALSSFWLNLIDEYIVLGWWGKIKQKNETDEMMNA